MRIKARNVPLLDTSIAFKHSGLMNSPVVAQRIRKPRPSFTLDQQTPRADTLIARWDRFIAQLTRVYIWIFLSLLIYRRNLALKADLLRKPMCWHMNMGITFR